MDYKRFFKEKKITMMGLGLLGRGINVALFLAECGAKLTITDLKSAEALAPTLKKLKKYKNIRYVLGEHRLEDFCDQDMIIKSASVPLDSPYIAEARAHNIPVEMDASLFIKLAPQIRTIGITGTRGKTTTTTCIYEMLKLAKKKRAYKGNIFLGGNIQGVAALPFLKKVKAGDTVVLELDSWQLQGFGDAGISPHIAVFTNFMDDHLNYYKNDRTAYWNDKACIFTHQTNSDFLIAPKELLRKIQDMYPQVNSHFVVPLDVPHSWNLAIKGEHNRANLALACAVGDVLELDEEIVKEAVTTFKGVEGRLELVTTLNDVDIYNDTTSTTPDALLAALKALHGEKNIVLIMGGADKQLDMEPVLRRLPEFTTTVVLLSAEGKTTGTDRIIPLLRELTDLHIVESPDIDDALNQAFFYARNGDSILFSPGFASFGMFKNEYDRGDKFNKAVKELAQSIAESNQKRPKKK